jgi:hypothetical protein
MAFFNEGDMYACAGTIMFGAGSTLTPDGELVMKERIKQRINISHLRLDRTFGRIIQHTCGDMGLYGVIFQGQYGIFQMGYRPNELDRYLFRFSMSKVFEEVKMMPFETYHIDLSSIGNGNGDVAALLPTLVMLPDNVRLWRIREDQ